MNDNQVENYLNRNNQKDEEKSLVKRVFEFLTENPKAEIKNKTIFFSFF